MMDIQTVIISVCLSILCVCIGFLMGRTAMERPIGAPLTISRTFASSEMHGGIFHDAMNGELKDED